MERVTLYLSGICSFIKPVLDSLWVSCWRWWWPCAILLFMQVSVNFVRTMLAMEVLVRKKENEFTTEDLLHMYCIVRHRRNSETHMYEGNHYLCLQKPNHPQWGWLRIPRTRIFTWTTSLGSLAIGNFRSAALSIIQFWDIEVIFL